MKRIYFLLFIFLNIQIFAQEFNYTHPELDWYTIESEHFKVHFHKGAERTARVVMQIGEDIYKPVTDLYDYRPDGKIHFIIKDFDDNSNGAAYYYDNKVEIWAPQMTFILRGTHNWLRNVVTHEFSHMISLGASRKLARRVPALYLQWIGYEQEKRPDVLYGYPNQIASYAIPMTIVPMWLAEGMAQYMISGLDYDRWDTHRDMLIRTAVVNDKLHTFDQMGVFGKNSLGNERTYNAGYALTRYIAHNYGEESLKTITQDLKKKFNFSVNGAIKNVTGKDAYTFYDEWKEHLNTYYAKRLETVKANQVTGKLLIDEGIGNISPVWSPDGKKIAYCGSKTSDYLSLTSLFVYDVETDKSQFIKGGINGSVAWSADGKKLLYQKRHRVEDMSHFFDLYVYDFDTKKEKKLTSSLRSIDPDWSPDGEHIVCIVQKDGTDNIMMLDKDAKNFTELTNFSQGEGVYSPRFSPDSKNIVFSQSRPHGRDIKTVNIESKKITDVVTEYGDARDPVYGPNGDYIFFAWDRSGIHNIYRVKTDGTHPEPVTNVIGGAFMPSVSKDNKLVYSHFEYDGYKIAAIEDIQPIDASNLVYPVAYDIAPELDNAFKNDRFAQARHYDDTKLPDVKAEPYSMDYGQMMVLPRVMVDSNKVKLGTYFYASDILERYSILGGVAMNHRMDLDAFAIFEYRHLPPVIFLELYAFTRNIKRSIDVIEDYPEKAPVDIQFNILEADIGARFHVTKDLGVRAWYSHQRYTSKIKDFFFQNVKWVSPNNTYFVGNHFGVQWDADWVAPSLNSSINPTSGMKLDIQYTYEMNDFFDDFATDNEYGTPQEVYTKFNYSRVQLNMHQYYGIPFTSNHALDVNLIGGWIDRPVDSFFNFFAGGLPGLRGYPFYSIEGRKLLVGRFTYRFPIFKNLQKRFLHITTNNLYLGAFVDYGNAFNTDEIKLDDFKKDAGVNLRFAGFSFYGFPTAFEFSSAYSLDEFEHEGYTYGNEWRHYISILFDFQD